jgi:hypothetical protein
MLGRVQSQMTAQTAFFDLSRTVISKSALPKPCPRSTNDATGREIKAETLHDLIDPINYYKRDSTVELGFFV